jgi:hypothetical protein
MYPLSRVRPRSNSGALLFAAGKKQRKRLSFLRRFIEEGILSEPTVRTNAQVAVVGDVPIIDHRPELRRFLGLHRRFTASAPLETKSLASAAVSSRGYDWLGRRCLVDRRHNRMRCCLVYHMAASRHAMHFAIANFIMKTAGLSIGID